MDAKEENFKRITEKRTEKIIDIISSFSNFTNTSFYEYTDEEVEEIFARIQAELDKQHEKLINFHRESRKVKL